MYEKNGMPLGKKLAADIARLLLLAAKIEKFPHKAINMRIMSIELNCSHSFTLIREQDTVHVSPADPLIPIISKNTSFQVLKQIYVLI